MQTAYEYSRIRTTEIYRKAFKLAFEALESVHLSLIDIDVIHSEARKITKNVINNFVGDLPGGEEEICQVVADDIVDELENPKSEG